jgi:hypothetical protein
MLAVFTSGFQQRARSAGEHTLRDEDAALMISDED